MIIYKLKDGQVYKAYVLEADKTIEYIVSDKKFVETSRKTDNRAYEIRMKEI